MIHELYLCAIPAFASVAGCVLGSEVTIPETWKALLFSTTAGLVAGSFITELVPEVNQVEGHPKRQMYAIGGIVIGAALMGGLRSVTPPRMSKTTKPRSFPVSLVSAAVADVLIGSILMSHGVLKATTPGAIIASCTETLFVSTTVLGIMNANGATKAQKGLASALLVAASIGGVIIGLLMDKKLSQKRVPC